MADLPATLAGFDKRRDNFNAWLLSHGSTSHAPTNRYEVTRFQGIGTVCVVYCNGAGRITTWMNGADDAYLAFLAAGEWRAVEPIRRSPRNKHISSIVGRDGWGCVYCGEKLNEASATLEHVVSIVCGGDNHLSNLALACRPCNQEASHLPARAKIDMAVRKRAAQKEKHDAH